MEIATIAFLARAYWSIFDAGRSGSLDFLEGLRQSGPAAGHGLLRLRIAKAEAFRSAYQNRDGAVYHSRWAPADGLVMRWFRRRNPNCCCHSHAQRPGRSCGNGGLMFVT